MRVGLDVDDVIIDLHTPWLRRINAAHGTNYTNDDMTQWFFYEPWGISEADAVRHLVPELYTEAKPHDGALEVVNALRAAGHEIAYISSCPDLQHWLAKEAWLRREGFLLPRDQAFPVGKWAAYKTKREVGQQHSIPVLVDDSVANCEDWAGVAYLLTRPHNRRELCSKKRLRTFDQILTELKYMPKGLIVTPTAQEPTHHYVNVEQFNAMLAETQSNTASDSKPTNPKDAVAIDKVPLHFVSGIVKAYAAVAHFLGNVKYGAWNYRAGGARASVYKAALDRHMDRWWEGEKYDSVDGTPHLANALACINILIECQESGNLVDDRPPSRLEVLKNVYAEVESIMPKIRQRYSDRQPKHYTIADLD